jgi:RNA polymerase sigma factor (sigma-70 family)
MEAAVSTTTCQSATRRREDRLARRRNVEEVERLVRKSVRRVLWRRRAAHAWDVDDVSQHVLAHLYANEGRALSSWEADRGLSFASYVSVIAQRAAISALRRRDTCPRGEKVADPWLLDTQAVDGRSLEDDVAERVHSQECVERLEAELSPLGQRVLKALYREEQSVEDASVSLGMSADALYTWRNRIRSRARSLAQEL